MQNGARFKVETRPVRMAKDPLLTWWWHTVIHLDIPPAEDEPEHQEHVHEEDRQG